MSLFVPASFASEDRERARQLIAAHPFATLITPAAEAGGEPRVTPLPLIEVDGELEGHLARANPQAQWLAERDSVAIFHGPHAYISPRWYAEPAAHVPTWNYATVQVTGRCRLLTADQARAALRRLTAHFEQGAFEPEAARLEALLPGIVAFRLPLDRLTAKFKMNQNRSAADRAGVIAGLRGQRAAESQAVADWMQADVR